MIMRVLPAVVLLTLLVHIVSAQKISAGYIVGLNKDTTKGFVVEGTDSQLAFEVRFKKQLSDIKSNLYLPSDLSAFGFDYGRKFERRSATDPEGDSITMFAKNVLSGKISLYIWQNEEKSDPDFFMENFYSRRKVTLTEPGKRFAANDLRNISSQTRHQGLVAYVKGDSTNNFPSKKKLRYDEKEIINDITLYNEMFREDFPVFRYVEQRQITHELVVGVPVRNRDSMTPFRISFYRNKLLPERSLKVSHVRGISYRVWQREDRSRLLMERSSANYREQFLSILPFGFNFQLGSGFIRPFASIGIGVAFIIEDYYRFNNTLTRQGTSFEFFPTVNVAAGARFKIGSKFISAQLTPTYRDGIFMNLGYSF